MMLYCRLLGAVLLVCTGFAAGQAYCQRLWAQWRAVCGFERLLTYLADQLAFHIIEIKVHIAVAVAREQDVLLAHDAVLHHLFLDELRHAFLDDLLALAGEWIHGVEAHVVLMAVHRIDDETVGVWSGLDARIIAVCIYRNIQCEGLARLHIVAPEAHLGVVLSCLRILVGILTRIGMILAVGRMTALK